MRACVSILTMTFRDSFLGAQRVWLNVRSHFFLPDTNHGLHTANIDP